MRDRDLGSYVAEAQKAVAAIGLLSRRGLCRPGAGSSNIMQRAESRTEARRSSDAAIIFLLLYLNFRRSPRR